MDVSFEPMDIDLSSSFNKSCEDKIKEQEKPIKLTSRRKVTTVKTYHINKENFRLEPASSTYSHIILFSLCALFIGYYMSIKCSGPLQLNNIKENLISKLYGQTNAIHSITDALTNESRLKLIVFYGGTGVGKTYASHLIIDDVKNCSNVFHYTISSFKNKILSDFLHGCNSTIIIVDDVTEEDSDFYIKLKNMYEIIKSRERQLTVILIYNCDIVHKDFKKDCDMSIIESIQENFNDIEASKFFVKFQPLTEIDLEKCIHDTITYLEVREVQTLNIQVLLKMFDVSSDGCKDVYGKIKSIIF